MVYGLKFIEVRVNCSEQHKFFFSTLKNEKNLFPGSVVKVKRSTNNMQRVKRKSHINPPLEITANKAIGYI